MKLIPELEFLVEPMILAELKGPTETDPLRYTNNPAGTKDRAVHRSIMYCTPLSGTSTSISFDRG